LWKQMVSWFWCVPILIFPARLAWNGKGWSNII
jgi:hypothetical protein